MKTIINIALFALFTAISASSMAQQPSLTTGSKTTNVVDSMQVDFVTKGAVMPYQTTISSNFSAWLDEVGDIPGFSLGAYSSTTQWSITGTGLLTPLELSADNQEEIHISWPTEGEYELKVASSVAGSTCEGAFSTKTVFVLPEPTVAFTAGDKMILACDAASHSLTVDARGIGEKQFKYAITKKPIGTAGTTDADVPVTEVGEGESTAGFFEEATTNFAAAQAFYTGSTGDTKEIVVNNLTPGYIYTVTVKEISDQISRKCTVTPTTEVSAVFTVVPAPTSTKINHIKNVVE